jgi:hypothetical protein
MPTPSLTVPQSRKAIKSKQVRLYLLMKKYGESARLPLSLMLILRSSYFQFQKAKEKLRFRTQTTVSRHMEISSKRIQPSKTL